MTAPRCDTTASTSLRKGPQAPKPTALGWMLLGQARLSFIIFTRLYNKIAVRLMFIAGKIAEPNFRGGDANEADLLLTLRSALICAERDAQRNSHSYFDYSPLISWRAK